jgi:hypothetical protein
MDIFVVLLSLVSYLPPMHGLAATRFLIPQMGRLVDLITALEDRVDFSKFNLSRYTLLWHSS